MVRKSSPVHVFILRHNPPSVNPLTPVPKPSRMGLSRMIKDYLALLRALATLESICLLPVLGIALALIGSSLLYL